MGDLYRFYSYEVFSVQILRRFQRMFASVE
jgi:hypothetical protein